jgi:hypothetical protein
MIHTGSSSAVDYLRRWQARVYHENATGPQSGVAYHARSDARSPIAIKDFLAEIFTE